jgi:adenylate cyclase
MASIWGELKRRNVVRVAVAYAVVAWLLLQVADVVLGNIEAPTWVFQAILLLFVIGFPLALIFAWAFELTPDGIKLEKHVVRTESVTHLTGRKLDFAIIGLLAIAVLYLFTNNYILTDRTADSGRPAIDAGEKSIAVLAFVNMSADPDNEYFSDGISEELLNLLTKLPQLKVSSRTSSFAFKGKDIDIPSIARQLGVNTVLEGSVRRAGNRVRITAQLVDATTDSHLWSETYDREVEDIFAVQDEIAKNIVAALRIKLNPGEQHRLHTPRTDSIEAYEYYLRGRAYLRRQTREGFEFARDMFARAIEIDPGYALAYAGLTYSVTALYRVHEPTEENLAVAEHASRKAVELAADLAEAHVARGLAHSLTNNYQEASREFDLSIQQNPMLFEAHFYYGIAAFQQGDLETAARLFEMASIVDPAERRPLNVLPQIYRSLGRESESAAVHERVLRITEDHLKLNPDDAQSYILGANSLLVLGESARALKWADRAVNLAPHDAIILYNTACFYSQAGRIEDSLDSLEKSYRAGHADWRWLERDTDLDPVRDHPRFHELVKQMKTVGPYQATP